MNKPPLRIIFIVAYLLFSNVSVCQNIYTVAGIGPTYPNTGSYSGDGGQATAAGLNYPYCIALDTSGNLYIADGGNNRIRKVNAQGVISTIAGNGTAGYSGDGGPATAAEIGGPEELTIDVNGNIYFSDAGTRIRKINTAGIISTIAGNGTQGYSGDGGPAIAAEFQYAYGVAVDASGNIYVADYDNNRIRMVNTSGIINTVAGNGTKGYSGDGKQATAAEIYEPVGICLDAAGNLFIADMSNNRVRKVNVSGVITTVAGSANSGYNGDGGPATKAGLNALTGVAVDAAGNIFIADRLNSVVREVSTTGIITTIAGVASQKAFSGDGGPATAANFFDPSTIAIAPTGSLYIADSYNNRVREMVVCSTPTISKNATICAGDKVALSASGGNSYQWSPATGLSSINSGNTIASPASTIVYTVVVSTNYCTASASVEVYVNPAPAVTACCNVVLQEGQSTTLSVSPILSIDNYYWTPVDGLSCVSCPNPVASPNINTTYYVAITDSNGCVKTDTVTVDISCGIVFIPEAFSPNGDGQNDVLYVRGDCIKTMQFDVFDRWGNKVFETNDKNNGWNGICKGAAMNTGSYVYYLNATMYDGTTVTKKGNVVLVR